MSDKENLIAMGFDSARIDCMFSWLSNDVKLNNIPGALRATNNSGLQPAMDFILAHNEDPIPDPASVATAASSSQPRSGPIGEEDEEDAAALGLQLDAVADVEARVSGNLFNESWRFHNI